MFDFKKIRVTFSILKLQKCYAYQNGVEFCHKPTREDIKMPPPLVFLPQPLWTISLGHLSWFPSGPGIMCHWRESLCSSLVIVAWYMRHKISLSQALVFIVFNITCISSKNLTPFPRFPKLKKNVKISPKFPRSGVVYYGDNIFNRMALKIFKMGGTLLLMMGAAY